MVHTSVQKGPVMGNQNIAFLSAEIPADCPAAFQIQMVGGFINEQKPVFSLEQRSQQHLGPLSAGQGAKRTFQHPAVYLQQRQLSLQLP